MFWLHQSDRKVGWPIPVLLIIIQPRPLSLLVPSSVPARALTHYISLPPSLSLLPFPTLSPPSDQWTLLPSWDPASEPNKRVGFDIWRPRRTCIYCSYVITGIFDTLFHIDNEFEGIWARLFNILASSSPSPSLAVSFPFPPLSSVSSLYFSHFMSILLLPAVESHVLNRCRLRIQWESWRDRRVTFVLTMSDYSCLLMSRLKLHFS